MRLFLKGTIIPSFHCVNVQSFLHRIRHILNLFLFQMISQESGGLNSNFGIFIWGTVRILFWWWLAELMIHLMYMHAIYSSPSHLEAVNYWTLGKCPCMSLLLCVM